MSGFSFIDLFAGLGGFHVAASSLGGKCLFASELDINLRELYRANFGVMPAGDIRDVDIDSIAKHDALFAGFPCQPFSKAGAQLGRRDRTRGRLVDYVFQITKKHIPHVVVLENVPNLAKQRNGKYKEEITIKFQSLGYFVNTTELSPHQLGVPQIRKRVYIVATRREVDPDVFLTGMGQPATDVADILDKKPSEAKSLSPVHIEAIENWDKVLDVFRSKLGAIPSHPLWAMESDATYPIECGKLVEVKLSRLKQSRGSFGRKIQCSRRTGLHEYLPPYSLNDDFPDWKQKFILRNRESFGIFRASDKASLRELKRFPHSLQKLEWNCKGDTSSVWDHVLQLRPSGIRVRRTNAFSSLVAMTTSQVPIVGWEKRYLTTLEMARLQSLDSLKHLPAGNLAHKAFGNAVNATVVRHILEKVL